VSEKRGNVDHYKDFIDDPILEAVHPCKDGNEHRQRFGKLAISFCSLKLPCWSTSTRIHSASGLLYILDVLLITAALHIH
jgi:hypothetical protein